MGLVFNTRVFLIITECNRNTTLNWKIYHFFLGVVGRICTRKHDEIAIYLVLYFNLKID